MFRFAHLALVAVFALVFGLSGLASNADAAVVVDTPLANVINVAANNGSGTVSAGNGANRLMVLGCTTEYGTAGPGTYTINANYGGQNFTLIASDGSQRQTAWIGYIDEAQIAAASNTTLTATINPTTNVRDLMCGVVVYENVDQGTPIAGSNAQSSAGAASLTFTNIPSTADGYAVYIAGANGQTATAPGGFTEAFDVASGQSSGSGGDGVTTGSTVTGTVTFAASTRVALAMATVNPLLCSDTDPATLTTTAPTSSSTVGGTTLIQTQVGTETAPAGLTGMVVNIAGSTGCNVTNGAMTWNGTSSRWEYTWDTSACGTGTPDGGVTINVSGTDPDCGTAVSATQITNVTIDNTCVPSGSLAITAGQTLNGNPIDLTSITPNINASGETYTVTAGTAGGPAIDEQEYFDTADDVCDYSFWTASNAPTANCGGPFNAGTTGGPLYVFNSAQATNGDGTLTASAGTGPTSLHSGTSPPGGFLFIESSGTGPYNATFTRNATFDATANEPHISYAFQGWGGNLISLRFQVNPNGTGWVDEWVLNGADANNDGSWQTADIDLNAGTISIDGGAYAATTTVGGSGTAYTSGSLQMRFVFDTTSFAGDYALDTIRVYGPGRSSLATLFSGNATQAAAVDTTGWTDGSTVTLDVTGNDATCSTPLTPVTGTFSWSACTENKSIALDTIPATITGDTTIKVTVGSDATGMLVGDSTPTTHTSPWVYSPTQDVSTSVTFYAQGTGDCATLTDSRTVNVNTMAAPAITAFSAPATVVDTAAPLNITPITFTANDNVGVTGYMIKVDDNTTPTAGDAGWQGSAPTSVTVPGYATYTLYAWAKDAAGNVSNVASASVDVINCTPGTVSFNSGSVPNPITGTINFASYVTLTNSGDSTVSNAEYSIDGGGTWFPVATDYTPSADTLGTVDVLIRAADSCSGTVVANAGNPYTLNTDTRTADVKPQTITALQNGLNGIRVTTDYCNDSNNNATVTVSYKLTSDPDIPARWTTIGSVTDGGAGDADGTLNESIAILLNGLTAGVGYDVKLYYADTNGVNSTELVATYGVQGIDVDPWSNLVTLVAWSDNPMLHNSNRFVGTSKHSGNWGTPGNYAGGIMCSTCHEKAPANGNIKRVKSVISFPDDSAMPGGGNNANVTLLSVEDTTSDLGDDSSTPRSSSNRVCEVCHTYDATQANGVKQHAANQPVATNHFDKSDCIKCHQHKVGFKADCTSCHGHPPVLANQLTATLNPANSTGSATAGKHQLHAIDKAYDCNVCHNGWQGNSEMPNNGNINIGFNINLGSTSDTTGTYNGRTAGSYTAAVGTSTTTDNSLTCAAIYCHGSAAPAWSDAGTAVCGSCHGDTNGMPSTAANDGDLSGSNTGKKVGKHASHVVNQGFACSVCHNGAGDGTALHVDGKNDIVFDTAQAGATAAYAPTTSTCSNLSCHSTAVWDTASTGGCDFCHGYPPSGAGGSTNHYSRTNLGTADADFFTAHNTCSTCHGVSGNIAPPSAADARAGYVDLAASGGNTYIEAWHNDGKVQLNGYNAATGNGADDKNAGYDGTGGCTKACHAASVKITSLGTNTVELREFGGGDCNGCHDTGTGGAPQVSASSSHTDPDGAGAIAAGTCTACHPGGNKGAMHAKNGDVNVVAIANNTTVGINYGHTVDTGIQGFVLGGDNTTGTTEAQICWNCHDGLNISEWGTNNAQAGSPVAAQYNYGTLSTSNWTTATWTSPKTQFAYKSGKIQSTHAASSAGTSAVTGANYAKFESPDAVANIRCSYCHDVHNTATSLTDDVDGKPYLRGTWYSNPYEEDGAPQSGMTYANNSSRFGRVPRGIDTATSLGGFYIDQNNVNPGTAGLNSNGTPYTSPTAGWTLAESAGLCTLCHGTDVDNMDQTTGENLWLSTTGNGHANAVIGGTGTASGKATNIFTLREGQAGNTSNPLMHFTSWTTDPGRTANRGYRNTCSSALRYTPPMGVLGSTRAYAAAYNYWGTLTIVNGNTTDDQYHQFSCSKCHNPHASRLPKLMITNCLDTKHNTWDDAYQLLGTGISSTPSRSLSNWGSAQNCHRRGGVATGAVEPVDNGAVQAPDVMGNQGWNRVTPWTTRP